jgi:hypothetical protein
MPRNMVSELIRASDVLALHKGWMVGGQDYWVPVPYVTTMVTTMVSQVLAFTTYLMTTH